MGKYFGTDGFRGEANGNLTADQAFQVGRFLGWYYGCQKRSDGDDTAPRIVIGKDTRRSCYMLEYSLVGGMTASGADAYLLHVTTTPSVAYVVRTEGFDLGVMISASHNPYRDNGIKLINKSGEKLEGAVIDLLESYLDGTLGAFGEFPNELPLAKGDRIGRTVDHVAGRNRYIGYLISLGLYSFKGMRVGLDCANGAAWNIAKNVFDALGAKTYVINAEPNGFNINENSGSTHMEQLRQLVVENGLYKALESEGIGYVRTPVGDKYVYEYMMMHNCRLGGEESGHIIFSKYASTGDGILTSLKLMEVMLGEKKTMSQLCREMTLYPQKTVNVPVTRKDVVNDPEVVATGENIARRLGDSGRILIRASGTEPVVRVMVEAETDMMCEKYAREAAEIIKRKC